jgi:hypothetical protein
MPISGEAGGKKQAMILIKMLCIFKKEFLQDGIKMQYFGFSAAMAQHLY